ncbi:MAG: methionyl-tRNA formyltransferase [Patescibacteria group bacterium]
MNDQTGPKRWRVIFAGTPSYAVPSLNAVAALQGVDIVGVLTQKAKPHGRGLQEQPSPVAQRAKELGIFTMMPEKVRVPEVQAAIRSLNADIGIVVAYGKILPESLLNDLPHGWVNAHASLLPRWRGASPIQHAILAGDTVTGVSLMQLEPGMDTGPTFAVATVPITPSTNSAMLAEVLAASSAKLLSENLISYLIGERALVPQPAVGITTAPKITPADGAARWVDAASVIERAVRAFTPWPRVSAQAETLTFKILTASCAEGSAKPGFVALHPRGCSVGTGKGLLILETIQPAGKKPMDVHAFLRGHPELIGATLA